MKVHILGICGTFMAGVAKLMIEKGYFSKEEFFDKLREVYAEYQINESAR